MQGWFQHPNPEVGRLLGRCGCCMLHSCIQLVVTLGVIVCVWMCLVVTLHTAPRTGALLYWSTGSTGLSTAALKNKCSLQVYPDSWLFGEWHLKTLYLEDIPCHCVVSVNVAVQWRKRLKSRPCRWVALVHPYRTHNESSHNKCGAPD